MLLAACSASNNGDASTPPSLEPNGTVEGNQLDESQGQDDQMNAEDGEGLQDGDESDTVFNPTPSPNFEQDYGQNEVSDRDYSDLEIVTLLPPDAIPAFTFPEYYPVKEANQEYAPDEFVIGIEFNGDARAYSVSLLSRHEIVNDTVGGIHLAVTW